MTAPGLRHEVDRLLVDGAGRLRLGWRVGLWALLLGGGLVVLGPLLPGGVSGVAGPLVGAGLLAGWAVLALDGRPPAALGFHLGRSAAGEATLGIGVGAGVAAGALALLAVSGGVGWSREAGTAAGWIEGAVVALWVFALPAAAEEVVFRGYAFQALAERWGAAAALAVTSLAFGALHLVNPGASWVGAANVAAAGVFLGIVVLRTASLWWASGVHLGWNWGVGYLGDLPVSGYDVVDAPLVAARTGGPEWLSGGAFGPEASVLATAAFAGAAVWAWRTERLRPSEAMLKAGPLATLRAGSRGGAGRPPGEDRESGSGPGDNGDGNPTGRR